MGEAKIIAVAGKGGVGKTSVSAMIVRILTRKYPDARILAIDADPAVGLATALGVTVGAPWMTYGRQLLKMFKKVRKRKRWSAWGRPEI